jgi:hypothetical protein
MFTGHLAIAHEKLLSNVSINFLINCAFNLGSVGTDKHQNNKRASDNLSETLIMRGSGDRI